MCDILDGRKQTHEDFAPDNKGKALKRLPMLQGDGLVELWPTKAVRRLTGSSRLFG